MVISPRIKGFICITAHPDGCRENVRRQMEYVEKNGKTENGPKNVLIIGASTGYGLASRIALAFGSGANTLGIMFEKNATATRTATPGYYNTAAFEEFAKEKGLYAETINGDAFSVECKEQTIQKIREDLGKVDMVIYSLAAPRRTTPDGTTYTSVLKPVGEPFTNLSWNAKDNSLTTVTLEPANKEEVAATVKVMGGEDWSDWIDALHDADVLSEHAVSGAYSYIGPELTYPIYKEGTIGMAKKNLKECSDRINEKYQDAGIRSYVSVNKAVVTQASAAIPVVPLYFMILYKVMKAKNLHEGCIEQMDRLFRQKLTGTHAEQDAEGFIRMDDWELREDVQAEVMEAWNKITETELSEIADVDGYWEDFYHMFGFKFDNVDYDRDVPLV